MADSDGTVIAALAAGRLPSTVPDDCEHVGDLRTLVTLLRESQQLAIALGRGELAMPEPLVSRGPIIGSLKALNASLRHLTWQVQRVAEGDLSHRVDFMGEFSEAFNTMVSQLAERQRMAEELRQSQKLQAVGRLAATMAHEINTPAQFVADNVGFLLESFTAVLAVLDRYRAAVAVLADDPARAEMVESLRTAEEELELDYLADEGPRAGATALDGVQRIATIVAAIKAFANPDQSLHTRADLNAMLRATITVANNRVQSVAVVETDFDDLPPVTCLAAALNEAFLALLWNARDAIADVVHGSGQLGRIMVRTRSIGDTVEIEIEDSGGGIRPEIRTRVFEPAFTTRGEAHGTGHGLTLARQVIVDQHHGSLGFDSEVGIGTTFRIVLPVDQPDGQSD